VATPVDPRGRFSGLARGYAQHRPSYPDATVDWLIEASGVGPGALVADVGCGTGILTRLLARRGLRVVGIDPNEEMLAEARAAGGTAEYRHGEAAATGLGDASVALVTAAQAFHWFDVDAALGEFQRLLVSGGRAAAIWNMRGDGTLMTAYDALLRRFSSEYTVLDSWESTLERLQAHPRVESPLRHDAPNVQPFDFEGLHGRAWSSSYVSRGVRDRQGFDAALRALFDAHARSGHVEFSYRTVSFLFRIAAPGASARPAEHR
jgi:SAM-dependent methyltransferase